MIKDIAVVEGVTKGFFLECLQVALSKDIQILYEDSPKYLKQLKFNPSINKYKVTTTTDSLLDGANLNKTFYKADDALEFYNSI